MHVGVGVVLAGVAGDVGQFDVDVVVAGEVDDGLVGGFIGFDLGVAQVVEDQCEVRVAAGNDVDLVGLFGAQVELDDRAGGGDLFHIGPFWAVNRIFSSG